MALPHPFGDTAPAFWTGGPGPASHHNFPNKSVKPKSNMANPTNHSQYPITTGTSVFGLKFKDGVMIAADTSGNYGSLSRYPNTQRVHKVNDTTVIASSGDLADFQYLHSLIKSKQTDEDIRGGGITMRPEALHCWLTRVLYNRRSKYDAEIFAPIKVFQHFWFFFPIVRFDPLWNSVIVGGMQEGKPFLGCVDYIGTAFTENAIATGIGAAMAIPIINHELERLGGSTDNLTKEQAREILLKCIRVCYLRDCRATNKYHLATITSEGSEVEEPALIDSNWEVARGIVGYD